MTPNRSVPLIDIIPAELTDAQCRALLRSSGKFKPHRGRWIFTPSEAKKAEAYLSRQAPTRH